MKIGIIYIISHCLYWGINEVSTENFQMIQRKISGI